jgi:hypothetical protein
MPKGTPIASSLSSTAIGVTEGLSTELRPSQVASISCLFVNFVVGYFEECTWVTIVHYRLGSPGRAWLNLSRPTPLEDKSRKSNHLTQRARPTLPSFAPIPYNKTMFTRPKHKWIRNVAIVEWNHSEDAMIGAAMKLHGNVRITT